MFLYKGAGPGTHWCTTDAQTAGGFVVGHAPRNVNAIIRHIVNYSWPSPYSSFSASFAAAAAYAVAGPQGKATPSQPGWVYEIDVALAIELGARFVDPAREILLQNPYIGAPGTIPTFHDGGQDLILGIADPVVHRKVLVTPPQGAFYFFLDFRPLQMSSLEICERILEEAGVGLVPGSGFGAMGEGFIRMTIAASDEDVEMGFRKIVDWAEGQQ